MNLVKRTLPVAGPTFTCLPGAGDLLLDVSLFATTPIGGLNSVFAADSIGTQTSRIS